MNFIWDLLHKLPLIFVSALLGTVIGALFGYAVAFGSKWIFTLIPTKRLWRIRDQKSMIICAAGLSMETRQYRRHVTGLGEIRGLALVVASLRKAYKAVEHKNILLSEVHQVGDRIENDVVLLGGPPHNKITEIFLDKIRHLSIVSQEGNIIRWMVPGEEGEFKPEYDASKIRKRDYALIVRMANPFSSKNTTIVLLSGGHTYGVNAAARYFTENLNVKWRQRKKNIAAVISCEILEDYPVSLSPERILFFDTNDKVKRGAGANIRIVEEQLIAKNKNDPESCEDAIVETANFACVIDGATSKSSRLWEGRTTGKMAAILVAEAIKALDKDIDCHGAVETITERIADYYRERGWYEHMQSHPQDRFTAFAVIYSNKRREIWMIGDCQCLVDGAAYKNEKDIDDIMANARSMFLEQELAKGKNEAELAESDSGKEFIMPLMMRQPLFQNALSGGQYAYEALDGFPVYEERIRIIDVNPGTKSIVIASDGYPRLLPTLRESEQALSEILSKDRLCISRDFKSVKGVEKGNTSFDDRAYLRIVF